MIHHGEAYGLPHHRCSLTLALETYCAKQSDYSWKLKKMTYMRNTFFCDTSHSSIYVANDSSKITNNLDTNIK